MLKSVMIKLPPKKRAFDIRAANSVAEGGLFDSKADTFTPKNRHIVCTYCEPITDLATALSFGVSYKPESLTRNLLFRRNCFVLLHLNLDFGEIAQDCPERGKLLASLSSVRRPPSYSDLFQAQRSTGTSCNVRHVTCTPCAMQRAPHATCAILSAPHAPCNMRRMHHATCYPCVMQPLIYY